jgi:hypothetical protein
MLKQPVETALGEARRVLLAGCGGGYDVLGAVPLMSDLIDAGHEVALANLSFAYLNALEGAVQIAEAPNLYEVGAAAATADAYCPEAWLARWMAERLGQDQPIWAFDKSGVQPLHRAYRYIERRWRPDAVILVDGGVDAMLRGDESSIGTPAEDLTSIAAVRPLDAPVKILVCFALGAEMRDGICHEQVFARMGELLAAEAYLGSAALLPQTRAGERYLDAVEYVFANQEGQRTSHVNKVVSEALRGQTGTRGPHIWISPLLSHFWFFSLEGIASTHLFISELWETETVWDVSNRIAELRRDLDIHDRTRIPI